MPSQQELLESETVGSSQVVSMTESEALEFANGLAEAMSELLVAPIETQETNALSRSLVDESEPINQVTIENTSLSLNSPLIDESEPVNQATVDSTYTPESQVEQSELPEVTQDESASTLPEAPQQFTREQLGKILGVSRETIRIWQRSGELERRGWAVVPKTGSTPKNPIKYQKQV